jgi:arylsulfatase A-like enzyme
LVAAFFLRTAGLRVGLRAAGFVDFFLGLLAIAISSLVRDVTADVIGYLRRSCKIPSRCLYLGAGGSMHRRRHVTLLLFVALACACAGLGCGSGSEPAPDAGAGTEATAQQPAPAARERLPNLVVFLVDTLRYDALGFTGAARATSPRLDRWAQQGAVFEAATTPSGWTRPAVVSLLTGLYPASHGVQDKDHVAPEALVSLAEVLGDAGYHTTAFITNFAVAEQFGIAQGFDQFVFLDKQESSEPLRRRNYLPIGDVSPVVQEFLANPPREPFFLYVHTTDPHFPYEPPAGHRLFGQASRDRYDAEVRYTDEHVGAWLDLMRAEGLLDRSVVVFTADHGEEFLEHGGTGHGVTVFDECVRVPLVVWAPGVRPGRTRALVSLTDLGPTLLDAAGLRRPPGYAVQGRSFWELAQAPGQRGVTGWEWAYSELFYPSKGIAFAYRERDHKLVHIVRDKRGRRDRSYLFDVARDPYEQRNLAERERERERVDHFGARLRAVRREHLANAVAEQRQKLEGEALERMRSLGYVD